MSKKPRSDDRPRKCAACGKTLPAGIRFCLSCGTHDEAELDARIADLDAQVERSHQRNFMHLLLYRLTFGLWRF